MKRTLALFLALAMLLSTTASALAYMDGTGIPGNWPAPVACNHSYYLYDTVINGTGSQLSQGQCQLLSIARCAVADPPVMILDEATSSVDTRTESLIQSAMDGIMGGRTTLVIAHRLSTVMNANAIMVLENGHIIERGDHDDLLEQKGRYYQLYTGNAASE